MRYIVFILLICSLAFSESLVERLQSLLQDKREKRVQILSYNPFVIKKEVSKKYKTSTPSKKKRKRVNKRGLRLVGIMGKRAFIDGRWVGVGDRVSGYEVKSVGARSVVLLKKRKKKILRFEKNEKIVKVREK